jgi:hypothetical protein
VQRQIAENVRVAAPAAAPTFSTNIDRLFELLVENGTDEYGELSPTQHVFRTASELIRLAEKSMTGPIPTGSPAVDSSGGIRFSWRRGSAHLRLICPSDPAKPIYICQQSPDAEPIVLDQDITPGILAQRLLWLVVTLNSKAGVFQP